MANQKDRIVKAFKKLPKSEQERLASSNSLLRGWVTGQLYSYSSTPSSNAVDPSIIILILDIIKEIIKWWFGKKSN